MKKICKAVLASVAMGLVVGFTAGCSQSISEEAYELQEFEVADEDASDNAIPSEGISKCGRGSNIGGGGRHPGSAPCL